MLKKKIIFLLWKKKTSSQKMQKSTTRKTDRNTNISNYNRKIMWKKMMSKYEMLITLFKTESSQELTMT